jgi:hypothetical protein
MEAIPPLVIPLSLGLHGTAVVESVAVIELPGGRVATSTIEPALVIELIILAEVVLTLIDSVVSAI